jgi:formamidopyrimidine-DNA glycosylase
MPELPEVERTVRRLRMWLRGRSIEATSRLDARILKEGEPADVAAVADARVTSVSRRAKYILLRTDRPKSLIVHLGMSGKMVKRPRGDVPKFVKLTLELTGGLDVHLVDPRVFARLRAVDTAALARHPTLRALGPEPLARGFDGRALGERLAGKKVPLKVALMDQAVVAGIGNIQSAEALWKAKLDPFRRAGGLSPRELARLVAGIRWTLTESLARDRGGETTYVQESPDDNPFVIYGRAGEPCPRCRAPLMRRELGGRGTYWCPRCQRGR